MRVRTSLSATVSAMAVVVGIALVSGCSGAAERLNSPPQGQTDKPSELQDNYARMGDNTMLTERSMSPVHFVPGSVELNSLGVRRLNRFAVLLKVYGGPLHYDGLDDEELLAKQRIERVKEYLVATGLGPDNFNVDWAMAGGSDMRGSEATIVRASTTAIGQTTDARTVDKSRKDIIEKSENAGMTK